MYLHESKDLNDWIEEKKTSGLDYWKGGREKIYRVGGVGWKGRRISYDLVGSTGVKGSDLELK